MNRAERELLEALARWERGACRTDSENQSPETSRGEAPQLQTLGDGALGDSAALRGVAEGLAARGWLRPAGAGDSYALTEDGRLALAGPLDVTLYTRPGCHLCDAAKAQIAPLLRRTGARLREVNIDADALLRRRYDVDVPVLFLGDRKVAKHRVDLRQFQRQLEEAVRSGRR